MRRLILLIFLFTVVYACSVNAAEVKQEKENQTAGNVADKEEIKQNRLSSDTENIIVKGKKSLKEKRAEVFKELGWEEGKYENEKERKYKELLLSDTDEASRISAEFDFRYEMFYPRNEPDMTTLIRAFIEGLYDEYSTTNLRIGYITNLGSIGDKRAISALKKLLDDEDISIRKASIQSLYYCGDKRTAFEEMVKLAEEGHEAIFVPILEGQWYFDPEGQNYILKIINYKKNIIDMSIATYWMVKIGSIDIAKSTVEVIEEIIKNEYIDLNLPENKLIRRYLMYSKRDLEKQKDE